MADYAGKQVRTAGGEHAVQRADGETRAWDGEPRRVPGKRTLVEQRYGSPLTTWGWGAGAMDPASPAADARGEVQALLAAVQLRADGGARGDDAAAVHASAQRGVATTASALPHRDLIQRAFGRHDVSAIRAHTGSEAAATARAMGAQAYATGADVVLGSEDLFTVAHEAAHVIQQRAGVALRSGVGEANDAHEQHADEVARLVVQGESAEALLDRYAGGPGAASAVQHSHAVQRKVGFEGELCVPSLGPPPGAVDMTRLAPGPAGQLPTPAIEQFLFGGLEYGIDRGGNEHFDLKPDHNELQGKASDLWLALQREGYLLALPTATMSNLEYVTKPIDELAPGADLLFAQQFAAVSAHAAALFPAAQQQVQAIGAPGVETYTGIPLADLQNWLGADYFLVAPEVTALRNAIKNEFGLQATVGIIPSAIRDLHKRHTPPRDRLAQSSVIELAMFKVDQDLDEILAIPDFQNHPYIQEMRNGMTRSSWGRTVHDAARPIDYESFVGVLHVMLMYMAGSALNQTGLLEGLTKKNAVPFLSKMTNMRSIITYAAPSLQAHRPPDDLIANLDRLFRNCDTSKLDWWTSKLNLADARGKKDRVPIVEDSFVTDMLGSNLILPEWIFGGAKVEAANSPRSFARPDQLPDAISQASGGQQGAQFEYRYIATYPPAAGLAAELFKVVNEVRELNMKHLSPDDQYQLTLQAAFPADDEDST